MKKVILKSLTLINFKGEKQKTFVYNEDITTVFGANGKGKSRTFDAFSWLLFSKDAQDRKDFNIRSLDENNEPIHRVDCGVIAELYVNDEVMVLKKMFVEQWVKPRGQVQEVFKGNQTETSINDVPMNVSEYQKRIDAIISEQVFKMITNPLYFANMAWAKQREQLFALAGTISDADIAAKSPEFMALLEKLTNKSLQDFKKELSTRKKKLKDQLDEIQPKIAQTHKLKPEPTDFEAIEKQIAELDAQIANIDKAIADKSVGIRQQYEVIQAKRKQIDELKEKQSKLEFAEKSKLAQEAQTANSARRELESEISSLEKEEQALVRTLNSEKTELVSAESKLEKLHKDVETKRAEWFAENAKEYAGDDTCSHCGQALPDEMKASNRAKFDAARTEAMKSINEAGAGLKVQVTTVAKNIEDLKKAIEASNQLIETKKQSIENKKFELSQKPAVTVQEADMTSNAEYSELTAKIKEIESTLDADAQPVDTSNLSAQKSVLNEQRDELKKKLGDKESIVKCDAEIKKLEAEGQMLAQQIADIENEEFTMQNFSKAKIEECERRINGMFSQVTFKLFDYTIDGNESETCVPLVNGVPFASVNTAGKVNAGLDIINALTKFYNVCAPIFIDGRESINDLTHTESQIINLVVTKDDHVLRIQ